MIDVDRTSRRLIAGPQVDPSNPPPRPSGSAPTRDGSFEWSDLIPGDAPTGLVPESLARNHRVFPVRAEGGRLTVVMSDPTDYVAIRGLEARTRMEVVPIPGQWEDILRAIDIHYSSSVPAEVAEAMDERFASPSGRGREPRESIREIPLVQEDAPDGDEDDESPVIAAVDSLMAQAVKARATDIHVEPLEDRLRVRFRIDGFLQEVASFPTGSHGALMSRLKVLAGMDIAERRQPQDGHFSIKVGSANLDVRAATGDTVHGEMMALRILNKSLQLFALDDLGLAAGGSDSIRRMLKAPYGILLVAGPTGAGKTTTLYGALHQLDSRELNIVTIEDPVEYRFQGVNSMQVNERNGLTFAKILRSVLRLDPDVVLVGEIRDSETARTAIQAALTGHLVLSSVHANDAIRAVTRVIDLGVEPFLLSSALLGVVAQRMVRRIDTHCPVTYVPTEEELTALGISVSSAAENARLYRGEGCYFCSFTGYHGRTGIFEVLEASEKFKTLITKSSESYELLDQAVSEGFVTMRQDGARKALNGVTTSFEVLRSVHSA